MLNFLLQTLAALIGITLGAIWWLIAPFALACAAYHYAEKATTNAIAPWVCGLCAVVAHSYSSVLYFH